MRILLAAALFLAAFDLNRPLDAAPAALGWAQLAESPFTLSSCKLNGKSVPLPERGKPTIAFKSDHGVSGRGGVNAYNLTADLEGKDGLRWAAGGPVITRMAGTAEAMRLEDLFFQALTQCDRIRLRGAKLTLSNAAGSVRMDFTR